MKSFEGKVVVVTGAGSGIGRATALKLGAEGARLALNDWNAEALEETSTLLGNADVLVRAFSVAERKEWDAFRAEVMERFGTVDGIINVAGIAHEAVAIRHLRESDLDNVMQVNFWGVVHGTQTFLPDLLERPEAFVANVSSIYGITAVGFQSAYCASKFAVRGFTEALSMEAKAHHPNLHVATIYPGGVATNITGNSISAGSRTEEEREADLEKFRTNLVTSPERAGETIVAGLRKKRARILIGTDAKVLDWMARLRPAGYIRTVLGELRKKGLVGDRPPAPVAKEAIDV